MRRDCVEKETNQARAARGKKSERAAGEGSTTGTRWYYTQREPAARPSFSLARVNERPDERLEFRSPSASARESPLHPSYAQLGKKPARPYLSGPNLTGAREDRAGASRELPRASFARPGDGGE